MPFLLVQLATAQRHMIDGVVASFVATMRATSHTHHSKHAGMVASQDGMTHT